MAARKESRGDVRIEFCLCDAAVGSAPLWHQPFRGDELTAQLAKIARAAMCNPAIVFVDHRAEQLKVWAVIRQRRGEFLDFYRRQTSVNSPTLLNVLLHMADGPQRGWINSAVGYDEGVIPFDNSLNCWTRPG